MTGSIPAWALPTLPGGSFDVVLVRHVLWAMPNPGEALTAWLRLLLPGGTLILVEGRWSTGASSQTSGEEPGLKPGLNPGLTAAEAKARKAELVERLAHEQPAGRGQLDVAPLQRATLFGSHAGTGRDGEERVEQTGLGRVEQLADFRGR